MDVCVVTATSSPELGVELKDAKAGTVEFPTVGVGHLVWRLGEADVQEVYTTGASSGLC
jgi:hypothetical protein